MRSVHVFVVQGKLVALHADDLDALMRKAWCQISVALKGPRRLIVLDIGPLGMVDVYLSELRAGIPLVYDCVAEVRKNGHELTDCGLDASDAQFTPCQGFLIPLTVTSSKVLMRAWNSYKELARDVSISKFLGSVFTMNPYLGQKRVDIWKLSISLHVRILRWLLSFDGECSICLEDFKAGKYH
eukprot:1189462-Rhodomonas_salina.1